MIETITSILLFSINLITIAVCFHLLTGHEQFINYLNNTDNSNLLKISFLLFLLSNIFELKYRVFLYLDISQFFMFEYTNVLKNISFCLYVAYLYCKFKNIRLRF